MPFYVPLGARGLVLHFGGVITRNLGSLLYYWTIARRRPTPLPLIVRDQV